LRACPGLGRAKRQAQFFFVLLQQGSSHLKGWNNVDYLKKEIEMENLNLVLLTLDEVRPDHTSAYGYKRISTPNIDRIAQEGVLFDESISSSCFTPISHAAMLTGLHPPLNGMRDAYSFLQARTLAEMLMDRGYHTAGFVGCGQMGATFGFNRGFELFDEPKPGEESWETHVYPGDEQKQVFALGSWWIPRLLKWIEYNHTSPFFVWGHFLHTHEGSEHQLLADGRIQEGELADYCYYDAKIKLADRVVVGALLELLERLGIYEDTIVAILSDHGTILGEHPLPAIPWRGGHAYPQHITMYDLDLRTLWVMKGPGLPAGKRIRGQVRAVDFAPTVLDLMDISTVQQFSGTTLLPAIESGISQGLVAYAEEVFEPRGLGVLQAIRTDRYKYIINRTQGDAEEFYDLQSDPDEQSDLIDILDEDEQLVRKEARELCNRYMGAQASRARLTEDDREKVKARLRMLGYIK
jgi:choline-sulfatase